MEINGQKKTTEHGKKHTFKLDKKLVRIEYPGLVKNIDKAIETLGGMNRIEVVISCFQITEQIYCICSRLCQIAAIYL